MINRHIARGVLIVFAVCMAQSSSVSAAARIGAATASAAGTTEPVFNNNQPVLNSGPSVTLSWLAPAIGVPISYVIEASSVPGGPANLANFNTGNTSTTIVVPGVPTGTYYVRIRALDASGLSAASNEVQVVVGSSCPSAPRGLNVTSQSGGSIAIGWLPPLTGVPTSYVIQVGSSPNGSNLVNFDTGNTALTLAATNVPAGSYFVRLYGRSSGCTPPAFLGPSSNEILLNVGTSSGWSGPIVCHAVITGPGGYHHDETQTWMVGGVGQTVGPRTNYPVQWSAQGSGGDAVAKSWTINATAATDLSVTIVASTGLPTFDRTTTQIIIRDGIVGAPTSFDLYEMEFPGFVASSANATSVSGTWSRPTVGGDSPQQPGGSIGTLSCTWSLTLR
jgi:hypothetical protein